jgi:hypothetical protein
MTYNRAVQLRTIEGRQVVTLQAYPAGIQPTPECGDIASASEPTDKVLSSSADQMIRRARKQHNKIYCFPVCVCVRRLWSNCVRS